MKKPSSKYNEEISSDSETERFVSDPLVVFNYPHVDSDPLVVCFVHSNVEPKKRRPVEEQEYEETPQEKKLRLAKLYIDQLKEEGEFVQDVEICNVTQYARGDLWCEIAFLRGAESR